MLNTNLKSHNADLALLGGLPINDRPTPRYNTIGDGEKQAVMEVLDSGELSGFIASPGKEFWGGRAVLAFEQAFKDHYQVKSAISVNSATSGLHCAVAAMGIGPGDEVIVPPYTMSATSTVVLMMGATPIFADIEEETFGLDPAAVEAAITSRTKGIIAVNLFGHPARLTELRAICDRHGIFMIEDNAQAPDAICDGRLTGTIGDLGVFSFNRHKTMQSGEGGVVIGNDEKLAMKAALFRNHGEAVAGAFGLADDMLPNHIGLNLRMSEMEAAVGRVQFAKLGALNEQRIQFADRLTAGLSQLPGITPPKVRENCRHVYYFYPIRYDEKVTGIPRDLFCKAVTAEGYLARAAYVRPLYLEPVYQRLIAIGQNGFPFSANPNITAATYAKGICPVVERMHESELIITNITYPPHTLDDMDAYVEAFAKVLSKKDALLDARRSGKV
jgi:perosamine synthetase